MLRFPVRLDLDEVVGPKDARRVIQAGQRVFLIILGVDGEQHADLLLALQICLERAERLALRRLLADLEPVRPVVADDPAPQRVVEIQDECLFVFPKNRLDDIRDGECERRDRPERERVLVHAPERLVLPGVEAVAGGQIVQVVQVEAVVLCRVLRKPRVQRVHEPHAPVHVDGVAAAEKPVRRVIEVVLDHRAVQPVMNAVPDSLEAGERAFLQV